MGQLHFIFKLDELFRLFYAKDIAQKRQPERLGLPFFIAFTLLEFHELFSRFLMLCICHLFHPCHSFDVSL